MPSRRLKIVRRPDGLWLVDRKQVGADCGPYMSDEREEMLSDRDGVERFLEVEIHREVA